MTVLVFGSINMDIVTACERHPHVGETVFGESVAFLPGGKGANQAIAAARRAGRSLLIGSVGADDFGRQMLGYLQANEVDTSGIAVETGISTGIAVIAVDRQGDNTIVVTPGANALARAPRHLPPSLHEPAVALAQLETPIEEVAAFFAMIRASGGATILNPSPYRSVSQDLLRNTSIVVLNRHEFAQLAGKPPTGEPPDILAHLASGQLTLPTCIVTLGPAGCILGERGCAPIHLEGHKVEARDTTGAGDCFAGWLAAELAGGRSLEEAARHANAAAALSVTRAGAGPSMPSKAGVESFLAAVALEQSSGG
jgi:ribokinase